MTDEALLPSFFQKPIKETTKLIKSKPKKEDEDILRSGVDTDFWAKVKEVISAKSAAVEDAYQKSLTTEKSLEQIGLRALMADLVVNALNEVVETVELPAKVQDLERASNKQ